MKISLWAWCAVVALSPLHVFSQQAPWTLDACVQYALEHNIQIEQSANQVELQENEQDAAWANLTPSINGQASYNFNFGLNIDPVTNQISQESRQTNSLGLLASWTLFDGTANFKRISQSRLNRMAALYDLSKIKNDVALNVASQYLQALLNKELLAIAKDQVAVTGKQVERMTILVNAGSRPQGDLFDLQAQLARDEQALVSAENNYKLSVLVLTQTLQLESAVGFELAEPSGELPGTELLLMGPESVYQSALDQQPQIKAAEMRVESANKGVGISMAGYLPTLSLQAGINTNYSDQIPNILGFTPTTVQIGATASNEAVFATSFVPTIDGIKPFGRQYRDNLNEFVGFSLNIPIYNRLQTRNNYRRAKISMENAQLSLINEKNALRQTIQRAHADATASYENYRAAERAQSAAEESFKYATARYENGALNQFDYENSRNSLTQAKSQLLRNKYDFTFRVKILQFYLDNPFAQP